MRCGMAGFERESQFHAFGDAMLDMCPSLFGYYLSLNNLFNLLFLNIFKS